MGGTPKPPHILLPGTSRNEEHAAQALARHTERTQPWPAIGCNRPLPTCTTQQPSLSETFAYCHISIYRDFPKQALT